MLLGTPPLNGCFSSLITSLCGSLSSVASDTKDVTVESHSKRPDKRHSPNPKGYAISAVQDQHHDLVHLLSRVYRDSGGPRHQQDWLERVHPECPVVLQHRLVNKIQAQKCAVYPSHLDCIGQAIFQLREDQLVVANTLILGFTAKDATLAVMVLPLIH